jgi:hypothetical protein
MGWRGYCLAGLLALASAGVARADVVEVTGYQVNLRERPSKTSAVLALLPRGERFELISRTGSWYHVRQITTGQVGYVHASLVQVFPGAVVATAAPRPPVAVVVPAPAPPAVVVVPPAPAPTPAPRAVAPAPAPTPAPRTTYVTPPPAPPAAPPAPAPEPEFRRFDLGGQFGYRWLSQAPDSAKAIFGETGDLEYGGFFSVAVNRNVFLSLSGTYFQKEGERVFLADPKGPWFRLGHPLKLRLIPVNLVVGWRFHVGENVVPWLAIGGGATFYREESTIGGITESVEKTEGTGIVMGGVDYVNGNLLFGLQASWSTVPNSVGVGGVSAIYGEDDLGGLAVCARLGVRF